MLRLLSKLYEPLCPNLRHKKGSSSSSLRISRHRAVTWLPGSKKRYPSDIPVTTVTFHQSYELGHDTKIDTLFSTDEGVAFILTCPEGKIYHAGDLNDWVWSGDSIQYNKQMTGTYRHEIDKIKGCSFDLAFLVLDPRQENDYARGMDYFLKSVNTKKAFPM